jgi:hypothetical protein
VCTAQHSCKGSGWLLTSPRSRGEACYATIPRLSAVRSRRLVVLRHGCRTAEAVPRYELFAPGVALTTLLKPSQHSRAGLFRFRPGGLGRARHNIRARVAGGSSRRPGPEANLLRGSKEPIFHAKPGAPGVALTTLLKLSQHSRAGLFRFRPGGLGRSRHNIRADRGRAPQVVPVQMPSVLRDDSTTSRGSLASPGRS